MTTHEFTTLKTADILDAIVEAVDAARAKMTANQASGTWFVAVDKAYDYLLQADTIAYDLGHYAIRVPSVSMPGVSYISNGHCQCQGFVHGGACWHRVAARIVRRALELQAAAPAPVPALRRCDDPAVSAEALVADLFC